MEERARAWLDNNCAHCHNPQGPARNSGLDLVYNQKVPYQFGVFRAPVAAGAGLVEGTTVPNGTVDFFADFDGEGAVYVTSVVADSGGNFSSDADFSAYPHARSSWRR